MTAAEHGRRRPPFDPELIPALEESYRQAPVTLTAQNLAESRRAELDGTPSLAALAAGGAELAERMIPGPDGAPDISLLIIRPPGRVSFPPCSTRTAAGWSWVTTGPAWRP